MPNPKKRDLRTTGDAIRLLLDCLKYDEVCLHLLAEMAKAVEQRHQPAPGNLWRADFSHPSWRQLVMPICQELNVPLALIQELDDFEVRSELRECALDIIGRWPELRRFIEQDGRSTIEMSGLTE